MLLASQASIQLKRFVAERHRGCGLPLADFSSQGMQPDDAGRSCLASAL